MSIFFVAFRDSVTEIQIINPALKKILTGNNAILYCRLQRKIERITKWRIIFQAALTIIIGIIFIGPVCLRCAEKKKKIKKAF